MEKTFILKGLDCPHCAAKIERDVKALDGVASAQLNLMKQTLAVTFLPNAGEIGKHIENIVHGYEPDVTVTEAGTEKDRHVKKDKRRIPQLILGGILFAAGLLMDKFGLILLIISYIILGGDVLLRALKNIIKGAF